MAQIRAVDLFCGAGGLSYGLKRAGIQVAMGVDQDETCRFPFERNIGGSFRGGDIRDVKINSLRTALKGADARLLAGCAPCQPFSDVNRYRSADRLRGESLLRAFGEIAKELRPEFVTCENVPSVQSTEAFAEFKKLLISEGYSIWHSVVDAYDYGAPQHRRRLICLATRLESGIEKLLRVGGQRKRTVEQAIGSLRPLEQGERDPHDNLHFASRLSALNLERIQHSEPGGTWEDWPEDLLLECHKREAGRGYVEAYGRMRWDAPAPTITTKFFNYGSGRFAHPDQDRTITPREAALIQGFPKDFEFVEPSGKVRLTDLGRMIGNAIPVPLGKAIGRTFSASLERL